MNYEKMKITREWHELRQRLFRVNGTVTESIIVDLNAAPHPDGPYLAKIIPLGADQKALFAFLIDHPEPLARLYGFWAAWRANHGRKYDAPIIDHSLSYFMRARTVEDYEEVAETYNEPDAWFEVGKFASFGYFYAASMGDSRAAYRVLLHIEQHNTPVSMDTIIDYIRITCTEPCSSTSCHVKYALRKRRKQIGVDRALGYRFGQLIYEFEDYIIYKCSCDTSNDGNLRAYRNFYLIEISAARKRVVTTILCLRHIGMYRDLTNLIARLVWADRGTYFDLEEPSLKKVKK